MKHPNYRTATIEPQMRTASTHDGRRTVRYTGNGQWQEIFSGVYNDQPFSQTFTASGMSTDQIGTLNDLKKRITDLKRKGETFKSSTLPALELRKDSSGVYTWVS